jgi:hypothetical protein
LLFLQNDCLTCYMHADKQTVIKITLKIEKDFM